MKPESPLFDNRQFEFAVAQQGQREMLSQSIGAVITACKGGAVTRQVDYLSQYSVILESLRFGQELRAIPHVDQIARSMQGLTDGVRRLRFAPVPHDHFEWHGIIAGESYFALFESTEPRFDWEDQAFDVLRLINTPADQVAVVDERGLYVAKRRSYSETVVFKIVDNPNYQKEVVLGNSIIDDPVTDERRFIPLPLTPQEAIAAADELELAARAYAQAA